MRPGANKARPLIGQGGQFDLQHAFAGAGAVGEDFKDQAGAVEEFDAPFLFEIALLDRAHGAIDQHQLDIQVLQPRFQLFDLAGPEQRAGLDLVQAGNFGPNHVQTGQGGGEGDSLGQSMIGKAAFAACLEVGMQDKGARQFKRGVVRSLPARWQVMIVLGVVVFG